MSFISDQRERKTPEYLRTVHKELGPQFQQLVWLWVAFTKKKIEKNSDFLRQEKSTIKAGTFPAIPSAYPHAPIVYIPPQYILKTEGFESMLARDEDGYPPVMSAALHHVLHQFTLTTAQLTQTDAYRYLEPYGQDFLDTSILGGLSETITVFRTLLLNATELVPANKRSKVLHEIVDMNVISTKPWGRFDSTLAALSFAPNGFWVVFNQDIPVSGLFELDQRTDALTVNSKLLQTISEEIRKRKSFFGGCPVADYHPSMPNESGQSAITYMGQAIVRLAEQLAQNLKFKASLPHLYRNG